jgi:osmotically-inducible protein OsmY
VSSPGSLGTTEQSNLRAIVPAATNVPGETEASDQRLLKAIRQALQRTGQPALRELGVTVGQGRARLTGRVPSYYLKQLAQHITLQLEGVVGIHNELNVD